MKFLIIVLVLVFGGCSNGDNANNQNNTNNINNASTNNNEDLSTCNGEVRDYDQMESTAPFLQHATEEAGENCPEGGQRLDRGTDVDDSDSLEGDEIDETAYVCDDARFPHAGEIRFYRLDDTYCGTTNSVLADIQPGTKIEDPKLIISPHAGWQFSGIATVEALSRIDVPELVVILGNNHFDHGLPYAVYNTGSWAVPTGDVPVDEDLAAQFIADVDVFEADKAAHSVEHSIEVQVMWLHRFQPNLRIVPIAIDNNSDFNELQTIAEQLAASLEKIDEPYLLLATTDLTHFDPADVAKQQDDQMIAQMVDRDPQGLFDLVNPQRGVMSMCALEPTVVGMAIANILGATESELIRQLDSSDYSGNADKVVGYASVILY